MTSKKSKKETIKPPTTGALKDAGGLLEKGHPAGGRVEAEEVIAIKQVAVKKAPSKKSSPKKDAPKPKGQKH